MKKNNRKFYSFFAIIITLILVVSYSGINFQEMYIGNGFTPLSISNIDVKNTDGTLLARTLAMTFRMGGLGGSVRGNFSPGAINNILDSTDGQVGKGFSFESGVESQVCNYPMESISVSYPEDNKLYKFSSDQYACILQINCFSTSDMESTCRANANGRTFLKAIKAFDDGHASCIYKTQDGGTIAGFGDPNYKVEIKNVLNIDGIGNKEATLSTGQITQNQTNPSLTSVTFEYNGQNIAYLMWQGNLSTGQLCKTISPSNKVFVNFLSNNSTTSWYTAERAYYNTYQSANNNMRSLGVSSTVQMVQNAVNQQNLAYDNLKTNARNNRSGSKIKIADSTYGEFFNSSEGGMISYSPNTLLQIPLMTLYIKADNLEFIQPKPIVAQLTAEVKGSTDVTSGGTIPINVKWKNVGDTGNFDVSVTCSGSFEAITNTYERMIIGGEQANDIVKVQGTCNVDTQNNKCDVVVTAKSMFGANQEKVTVTGLKCNQQKECVGNVKVCENIYTKKSCIDGFWKTTTCEDGFKCNNGECVKDNTTTCGNGKCDLPGDYLNGCAGECTEDGGDDGSGKSAADRCLEKEGDGLFILGYSPQYNIVGFYSGCEPIYNVVLIAIILGIVGIGGFITVLLFNKKGGLIK